MNNDWKYILLDFPMSGYVIILFPPHMKHSDMKNAFPHIEAVSAGFVKLDELGKELICYGKSDSLGLSSKPDDSFYANYLLKPPE